MILRRLALALTASVVLASCATPPGEVAMGINTGDSQARVREVMGPPQDRQVNGAREAWQYCGTGAVRDGFVAIFFDGGKVSKITPYQGGPMDVGLCRNHFRPIQWEPEPGVVAR